MISTAPKLIDEHLKVIVVTPVRILLILVLALVARALVRRAINRLGRPSPGHDKSALLRPLREKVDVNGLLENAGLLSERRRQRTETIGSILRSVSSVVIFAVAAMLILSELEVNLAPIVASAGILGVAVGFGAQNLVKDYVSGIFMILEDQYGVGDIVDVGPASGTVEEVGLRITRLRDVYGTVWYVRNGEILRVGNSSMGYSQVVLDTPVPADADVDAAGRAIKEAADALAHDTDWSSDIIEDPQLLGIEQLTDDKVMLRLTVKTRPAQQWRVGRELRRRVLERLDADRLTRSDTDSHIYVGEDAGAAPAARPDAPHQGGQDAGRAPGTRKAPPGTGDG